MMFDIKLLAKKPDVIKESLDKRSASSMMSLVEDSFAKYERRNQLITEVEALKEQRNKASEEIGKLKKEGKSPEQSFEKLRELSQEIKTKDAVVSEVDVEIKEILAQVPNILHSTVPEGADESANEVVRVWGKKPEFDFKPKSHFEIGEDLGLLNFEKAGDISGSRFVFLKGLAVRWERALSHMMIENHVARGYEEILPPYLVNENTLYGTGQFPKFKEDVFKVEGENLYLIPTAEVPVTNYYQNEILKEEDLPQKFVVHTPCFRSEAGSYGKDTRGLKRQHQFHKVELVKFATEENSFDELETLLQDAESILQKLNLHYRVVKLCGGDTGFSARMTYDIEVWLPSAQTYMEISSCSNCGDFQARRANIRYKSASQKKPKFVHTLNGSGLAVGRTLVALVENFQTKEGQVNIPGCLGV